MVDVALSGTIATPYLEVVSDYHEVITIGRRQVLVREWLRSMDARWDSDDRVWKVFSTPGTPGRTLARAGIREYDVDEAFADDVGVDDVYRPIVGVLPDDESEIAVVYPRMTGYEAVAEKLPKSAKWEKAHRRFRVPVVEIIDARGQAIDPSFEVSDRVARAAMMIHFQRPPAPTFPDPASEVAKRARMLSAAHSDDQLTDTEAERLPDWMGLDLFGFQRSGAIAVADGHTLLADAPGLGKTRQSIAAAAITGSSRTLIVCPPVVVTNWGREVEQSGLAGAGGVVAITPKQRKQAEMPDEGVVVVSDSLLVSRPQLVRQIKDWKPTTLIYDEAHRAKTWDSKRAWVMREVAAYTRGLRICVTGTPVLNSTVELASILAITGHLDPFFGGIDAYLDTYCRKNKFRVWETNPAKLGELKRILDQSVWVRRTKADVLPDLPAKLRRATYVDVNLADYRAAHGEVLETITDWLEREHPNGTPDKTAIEAFARSSIGLMSPMRKAAGVAKIPAAAEMIEEWAQNNPNTSEDYDSPLLMWAHHHDVVDGLADACESADVPFAIIDGSTRAEERAEIVDEFQAGRIDILICSISAAAVGITLTHGCDMVFVEQDWVPAMMLQAEDRMARIGQTRPVSIETLVAVGTLDEQVHTVLEKKTQMLDTLLEGGDNSVTTDDERERSTTVEIVSDLVHLAVAKRSRTRKKGRARV